MCSQTLRSCASLTCRGPQSALEKHLCSGAADVGNALGEAGFKGHPSCSFCAQHFYGGGELFTHMQREHFTVRARASRSSHAALRAAYVCR